MEEQTNECPGGPALCKLIISLFHQTKKVVKQFYTEYMAAGD